MKKVLFGILTLGLVFLAAPAFAATTADVTISADVVSSCSITALPLDFGDYDALSGSPAPGTGSVDVACSVGSNPKIWLDGGLNELGGPSASAPARQMKNGTSNFLAYQLYQQVGLSNIWGATDLSSPAAVTATSLDAVTSTIFGSIPAGQLSTVGAYSDTVVATVNF
jgi:spore coat protein U-like protein